MKSLKLKSILLFGAMLLCVSAIVAQPQQGRGGRGGRPGGEKTPEEMAKAKTEKMAESLKLTDAQKKKMYDLNLKYAKEADVQRKKMQEAEKVMQGIRKEMGEKMKAQKKEVMSMLNDDQKIEFIEILTKSQRGGKPQQGNKPQGGRPQRGGRTPQQGAPQGGE